MMVAGNMQTQVIKTLLISSIAIILGGCSISDWYNGYYAEAAAMRNYDKREKAYYDSHSPEWREAFKKNSFECADLAKKPENRVNKNIYYPNGESNQGLYIKCMKEKGTAVYDGSW